MERISKRLLSFVLVVLMVVSMVPASVFAVETDGITTEAELAAALNAGGEVKLDADIDVSTAITIDEGVEVTLDLAGHKINGGWNGSSITNHIYVISNYGTLTVKDSAEGGAIVSRGVYNYSKLTLESGTIDACDGNGGYAVNNEPGSTFIMNGGTVSASYEDGDAPGAGYDATALDVPANCVATLNGGTVSCVTNFTYAIANAGTLNVPATSSVVVTGAHGAVSMTGGTATIEAGTFVCAGVKAQTDNILYVTGGEMNISGGTFTHEGAEVEADSGAAVMVSGSSAVVNINGGSFTGLNGALSGNANTTVTGGTFANGAYSANHYDDVSEYVPEGYAYDAETGTVASVVPKLPTATVTEIDNQELTFALNFKADQATEEQLAYYGDWYADFVLTINKDVTFNADGSADGYLSGQYDEWSENWVDVPYNESVTLEANAPLKIMEFAAELMGKPGLQVTYNDVYTSVKDFDCGVFFEKEFLAANPDLVVTLELRIYNPADETESYAIGETYVFSIPELPTATVTEIANEELTFALNFKADQATEEQLAYYGDWHADFVLTINKDVTFNADGSADGYLSGQYDGWSENWVNVPDEDVSLSANTSLKIMEYAMKRMGYQNALTYQGVYEGVKDFDCGVFFSKEFLEANPDLEVTLELRMYNPADETESYVIGETYTFSVPELPTATVTEIENEELTFALNFKADEATEEQLAYYGDWYADYVLTINKDVTFYTGEGADGYLSGQYDAWSENWVDVPYNKAVTLAANTSLKIMEYAAELMGKTGLKYTYAEVYKSVKDFDCGVFFTDEFLAANPDLEVTLELRMFNPADETESYIIGETYVFTLEEEVIAENTTSGNTYATVSQALALAQKGETVRLLGNASEEGLFIAPGKRLDLNGKTMTVDYANSAMTGSHIIDSTNGKGLLKVERDMLSTLPTNEQLPVWVEEDEGFRFASASFAQRAVKITANGTEKVQFKFYLKGNSEEYLIADELADGTADNDGLTIRIKMICTSSSGIETEYFFTFPEVYAKAYGAEWTTDMMWMNIAGLEDVEEVTFSAMICYDKTVAVIAGNPVTY